MKTIHQHIESVNNELYNPNISSQRRRHLEAELNSLERYKEKHPGDERNPSPLELFCDENPGSIECKIFNV